MMSTALCSFGRSNPVLAKAEERQTKDVIPKFIAGGPPFRGLTSKMMEPIPWSSGLIYYSRLS
jgi:hypothetical protein